MRSTIKSWAVLLSVTMTLCAALLAGCVPVPGHVSRDDALNAVSCTSADSCVAVGSAATVTGQTETALPAAVRWDGSHWHPLAVRLPPGAVEGRLFSVSCRPGGCLAVGNWSPQQGLFALAEYWNDSTWTPVPLAFPPGPTLPSLLAVSCVTVARCVATGDYLKPGSADSALAAAWDGRAWSWSRLPARTGATGSGGSFPGASCATAKDCVAIVNARRTDSDATVSFAERWNGHGWAPAYALAPGGTGSYLYGVACAGQACLAVGGAEPANVLTWNGATWAQAPPRGTIGTVNGVTCVAAADCVAVGSTGDANGTHTVSEFWNGSAWTIVRPPTG